MNSDWLEWSATASDMVAQRLVERAYASWWTPLWEDGWRIPDYLAFDLGVLLLRPQATIRIDGTRRIYGQILSTLAESSRFRLCAQILQESPSDRQDEAIRIAIQALTRLVRSFLAARGPVDRAGWHSQQGLSLVSEALALTGERQRWLEPIDALALRAATRVPGGHRLLDYQLLDACLKERQPVRDHVLRWRRVPTRIIGRRDISRQQGEGGGYTALRSRLSQEEWHEILPSEWGLFEVNEALGLDKLLNRHPLVYRKEAPHDFVPFLRLLLVYILEADFLPANTGNGKTPLRPEINIGADVIGRTFIFRSIFDLVEQVPRHMLSIDLGIFIRPYKRNVTSVWSFFPLEELQEFENAFDRVMAFDRLVPGFFYVNKLGLSKFSKDGGEILAAEDPFVVLNAAAASPVYSATLAVLICRRGRFSDLLPTYPVALRPPEAVRPAFLAVEARSEEVFGVATFRDFHHAMGVGGRAFVDATEVDVREVLLTLIFGPQHRGALIHV